MARAGQMAASGGPPGRADRPCGVRTSRRAGPPLLPALLLPLLLLLLLLLLLCCAASCDADGEVDPASRPGPASDGGEASRTDGGERETGSDGAGPDCFPTAGGSERCDGLDNDCNGVVDDVAEGNAQLLSDPLHCGGCYRPCEPPHAFGLCEQGRCVLGPCEEGYADMVPAVEGLPDDGCETRCDAEHFQGQEVCDGRDNDCDGEVDEGFDLDGDIDNCGRCGRRCLLDGVAEGLCSLGECLIVSCAPGFFDRDGEPANGCEYPCVVRGDGVERCNGLDDDCDGAVDEAAELQLPEMGCLGGGVCQGVQPSCGGLAGWYCPYPEDLVEFPEERSCDGLDNDCDGATDETFPQKGSRCLKGEGACRGEGTWQCTPDGRALHCTGTEHPELASPETCNGLDDDCDGEVDNDPLDLIWVQAGAFRIFAYEASRPDAGPERAGVLFGQACSRPGVLPWNEVSHEEAALGCALGGWRLCTLDELRFACGGPAATRYPYGNDFREDACNGGQADPATGHVAATGAFAACTSSLGAFDLSGNLKEWTATPAQAAAGGRVAAVHLVTGGAYDSSLPASLGCGAEPVPRDDSFRFPNLGFRCCWP